MIGRRFRGGGDLSGGEWQKIAIARAYMREAAVLILDEPTASLDARSEYEIFERFKELSEGRTVVLISHRFSSVRMAELPERSIQRYVASGEPFGKAGAYAVQGRIAAWIERIEGSYTGIMGLPLFETARLLARAGKTLHI